MKRTELASRWDPRRFQLSESKAGLPVRLVAEEADAAPSTTSAPTTVPTARVLSELTRRTSGTASAADSAIAPYMIALEPTSVAGHPTPATVAAAAPSGRRAATSREPARVNPKIAERTSMC